MEYIWSNLFLLFSMCILTISSKGQETALYSSCGLPGMPGPPGRDGRDGRDGMTVYGPQGPKGEAGSPGLKGDRGEDCPPAPPRVKQCSWEAMNDGRDEGIIKTCTFHKRDNDTALRVTWHSDLRVYTAETETLACVRWYFTFNGTECQYPHSVDAIVVSTAQNQNQHRPATVDGICEHGLAAGQISVAFNVGACSLGEPGDAHTGWLTTSRMIIEELHVQI